MNLYFINQWFYFKVKFIDILGGCDNNDILNDSNYFPFYK